jgi:galactoside O-acetyltransferase
MPLLDPGYLSDDELSTLPFKSIGNNVKIGKNSTFIGLENISLGSNIRIDGNVTFAAASGHISVGNYVHIGGLSHFSCSGGIEIGNYCTFSQGVRVYSASDDYSGKSLTNSTTPASLRKEVRGLVTIDDHVIIGSGSVVLPNCTLQEGSAVGALSMVNSDLKAWSIYGGTPAKRIRRRSRDLLNFDWLKSN